MDIYNKLAQNDQFSISKYKSHNKYAVDRNEGKTESIAECETNLFYRLEADVRLKIQISKPINVEWNWQGNNKL